MIRLLFLAILMIFPASVQAGVINVEFHFAPFVGDPKNETVETIEGQADIFLNGIPLASSEIRQEEVSVLFDDRQISAPVWVPVASYGSLLRKGKNTIRVEFKPADAKKKYRAQLRWASVMDETTESESDGKVLATNQGNQGVDDKKSTGPVTMEREFTADFASDQPWHHYPPVTTLSDDDKKTLMSLTSSRLDAFKPDFAALFALVKGHEGIDIAAVKKSGCLARAYKAGIRLATPPADKIKFVVTGQAAVIVQASEGQLFFPADPATLGKITKEEDQSCIGRVLQTAYPPRLIVVRNAKGAWEVVD